MSKKPKAEAVIDSECRKAKQIPRWGSNEFTRRILSRAADRLDGAILEDDGLSLVHEGERWGVRVWGGRERRAFASSHGFVEVT